VAAAIELITEVGPLGFTLREVARRAGVSHNAPYRHFPSKEHLLAAVANQGFIELNEAMLKRAEEGTTPAERLKLSGLAYVDFALRRPAHFTVMFDVHLPEASEAGQRAFNTLLDFVAACNQPPERALQAWSLVHGIAKLAIARQFPFHTPKEILQFADSALN